MIQGRVSQILMDIFNNLEPKRVTKYLPFLNGTYSTAPGLSPMTKTGPGESSQVFAIDDGYDHALANKQVCRDEDIRKYYCEARLDATTQNHVNHYIAGTLVKEHPQHFELQQLNDTHVLLNRKTGKQICWNDQGLAEGTPYLSTLDALCCQIQEDIAVFQLQENEDWLAAIHLCAPNHWDPHEKIGHPFHHIHAPVPGMERTLKHYPTMLSAIVAQGAFTRFAWGIATDTRLNHHPIAPDNVDHDFWYGRRAEKEQPRFYIRTERQNLVGFREVNAFLFTIHTYFYDVATLTTEEKKQLLSAIQSMSPATLEYKGLTHSKHVLETILLA
ncbi:MAG TPA: heme-dependent oxidative N-demethylase subunit alpha family protein [Chryseolinea sp.]